MSTDTASARRFEWKYLVPSDLAAEIEQAIRPHMEPDTHCVGAARGAYTVRSVYYDTPDLRFYHEKLDGLRVRRKLRVRGYGDAHGAATCFLEIKRKQNQTVLKERASLPLAEMIGALNGHDPAVVMVGKPYAERRTLERFRYSLKVLGLIPTVLVCYQRRAFVARNESRTRVTFDGNLRSLVRPREDGLFQEADLRGFEADWVIELKFDERAPKWLMRLVAEYHLRREPYSKYCHGIDGWADTPEGLAITQPRTGSSRALP